MFSLEKLLERITDNYAKNPESRLGRLLRIMSEQLQDLGDTLTRIEDWRDIDNAEGTTLDNIGRLVLQPRGAAEDEVYRVMIKGKIAQNLSTGDINTIINVLSVVLDVEYADIKIEEMFNDPSDPEPAAIRVVEIPLQAINESGISPNNFAKLVQRTVAAGVRVGIIELTGTFSFGEEVPQIVPSVYPDDLVDPMHMLDPTETVSDTLENFFDMLLGVEIRDGSIFIPEYDPEAGFADIAGTIGGYFGAAFSSDDDQDLPI